MADWSGQISTTANARGVWMRAGSMIEHIPSFPGDTSISEIDAPSAVDEVPRLSRLHSTHDDTEVTDTTGAVDGRVRGSSANRGPITDPPSPSRMSRPRPAPLFDEAPDAAEVTPPTWDMGLLPATYADAEVTEDQIEPPESRVPAPQRAVAPATAKRAMPERKVSHPSFDLATDLGSAPFAADLGSAPFGANLSSAAISADMEQSVTLELLDDWMEHADDLHIEAPRQQLMPVPNLSQRAPHPSGGAVARRAPAPRIGAHNRASATHEPLPRHHAPQASASVRSAMAPDPHAFDSHAVTRPTARRPGAVIAPYPSAPVHTEGPSAFERAGWWAAGALSGMIGACVLASLAFAAALLV
ncbi:MAG: hypothetical protein R3F61_09255 [Myxococcota bacterium]